MAPRRSNAKAAQTASPKPATTSRSRGQRRQARQQQDQAKHDKARQRINQRHARHPAERLAADTPQHHEAQAKMTQMPIVHEHAAGIEVGDASHWVGVDRTPEGSEPVREFAAMTHGLRETVAWLQHCGVPTIALEATGAYAHVLFLTLIEAGFQVVMAAPQVARPSKGRPKTDKRDCRWMQRLHELGMLPSTFQPEEATQTLRDYVRQRANHVRLSGQHTQRMQKALELMTPKLTKVLADVTGVTGLKILRALVKGERDPRKLDKRRDRRCQHAVAAIAQALDGRYRPEHVLELKLCLTMWEHHQAVIAELDKAIDQQLQKMQARNDLPPLPPEPRKRGRRPHDATFDGRTALDDVTGVDLTLIEGIDERHALTSVSELGNGVSKGPTVKHFTSWLGLCPNWKKTGGKV